MNNEQNKFVVYTAVFGDYDSLREPSIKDCKCDFICFTDQHFESDTWIIVRVEKKEFSDFLMNRLYKFLPHKFFREYEFSLYVDGNITINSCPYQFIQELEFSDCAMPEHKNRESVYQELIACYAVGKITLEQAINHYDFLKLENYPLDNGLTENNIILRRHNSDSVIRWGEGVWNGLLTKINRDQLLAQYCFLKHNCVYSFLSENCWSLGESFSFSPHKNYLRISIHQKILRKVKYFLKIWFLRSLLIFRCKFTCKKCLM